MIQDWQSQLWESSQAVEQEQQGEQRPWSKLVQFARMLAKLTCSPPYRAP
jgi:hypothetical protein